MSAQPYQTRDESHLRVAVKEEQISVAPGNEVELHIGVVNESANHEDINLSVTGVSASWLIIDTPVIHLPPGQARQVMVKVQPPAVPEGLVGQYPLTIQATSQNAVQHSA